jgi:hypothetical protein
MAPVVALLMTAVASAAPTPITFKPEILLMRSTEKAKETSFKYAALSPKTIDPEKKTAAFAYSADNRNVSVTIKAEPPAKDGTVRAIVTILRKKPMPDGSGEDTMRRSTEKVFVPGKPVVVERDIRISEDNLVPDGTVELVQLTLVKG